MLVGRLKVEPIRVEILSDQSPVPFVLGINGIGQRLEQVRIAGRSARVLRREGACPAENPWVMRVRVCRQHSLHLHLDLRVIIGIIEVAEPSSLRQAQGIQMDMRITANGEVPLGIGPPIVGAGNEELVRVVALPPRDHVNDFMEPREGDVLRDKEASPDRRVNAREGKFQPQQRGGHSKCRAAFSRRGSRKLSMRRARGRGFA